MKNAIFTGKRKTKLASVGMISVVLISVLFLAGCFDFNFINQPYQADPNSSFEVELSAWASSQEGAKGKPYFGILLPIGWEVEDSIEYAGITGNETGMLIYSDSLSQAMTIIEPPIDGYYWWVAADTIAIGGDTYDFDFHIFTDNQAGSFFLDYMLGSGGQGLNYRRSNDHLIIIGVPAGCAPEGIVFSTQAEVDNFQANYPGCSEIAGDITISGNDIANLDGLNAITSIGGSLRIISDTSMTNLSGLTGLASIGGTLSITGNSYLTYILSLNNLTSVGRSLLIEDNTELVNISGLNALTEIGIDMSLRNNSLISFTGMNNLLSISRNLIIEDNSALHSLIGMNNLTSIGGNLSIRNNSTLNNLTGLNNLTSTGGYFIIYDNTSLTSLFGLEKMTSIGGDLGIYSNDSLTSLTGLEGLTFIGGNLYIGSNPMLCNCEVDAICAYLAGPTGTISIYGNASGCSSLIDVAVSCGTTLPCLEEGYYHFYSQFDVDHFPTVFPGCSEILCNVNISGDDITNLDSLSVITSIQGNLSISSNGLLNNLSGLEGLDFIGGGLYFSRNDALNNLTGLDGLNSIGTYLNVSYNDSLTSFAGFENLSSIGGYLRIYSNNSLNSLSGFEDLNSVGGYLEVSSNEALTSLTGLAALTSIGSNLEISHNATLSNLMGLDGLTTIGGALYIYSNDILTSLTGLDIVTSIGGNVSIIYNPNLTSLTGLDNLTSLGGSLEIIGNNALSSLTGLEGLTTIGGDFTIYSNDALTNFTGLEGLTYIGGDLVVYNNLLLADCDVEFLCTYLSDPNGVIEIYGNADGCSGIIEVAVNCGTTLPCLNQGTYELTSQFEVDHFPVVFQGCSDIACNVTISGDDITNLDSLYVITSIGGNLFLSNTSLVSLTGLEGLTSIGGNLSISSNDALVSLAGLEGLTSIGGSLYIYSNPLLCNCEVDAICAYFSDPNGNISIHDNDDGCSSVIELAAHCGTTLPCMEQGTYELTSQFVIDHFPAVFPDCSEIACNVSISGVDITNLDSLSIISSIQGNLSVSNTSLVSLAGLEGLTYIGGNLSISSNDALVSLAGLEGLTSIGENLNISSNDALVSLTGLEGLTSIGGNLEIGNNPLLCNCDIDAICTYLSDPNGYIYIYNNDDGCSSVIELAAHCGTTLPCMEQGTYKLTSQFVIDHFPAVFPGCSEIACNVSISGVDITNLDSLSVISSIQGNLSVSNTSLVSLAGLDSLTFIGGFLEIGDYYGGNPSLTSLNGL
jgi:acyl-[acyl carrier protein]--UDP-N-acetylglucosamine O-acyltransferase